MQHANGWKRSAVDDLLDKTESGRDQCLGCDELDDSSVKYFEREFKKFYYCRKYSEDKHDPEHFEGKRPSPLRKEI